MYDSESNLYYYRNRIYSPELGRFVSKDPKGYVDGMNLYAYVKNNPIRYLDPMGTSVRDSRSDDYDVVDYIENITMNGGSNNNLLLMLQASEIAKTFVASENVQSIVNDPSNRFASNDNAKDFQLYIGNTSKVAENNLIKVKDNQPIQQYQASNIGSSIAEVAVKGYYDYDTREEIADTMDKVSDVGVFVQGVGIFIKNPIMIGVGESINVGATTIKIMVDPKHYEPYEILNEYVDPWLALTPLY